MILTISFRRDKFMGTTYFFSGWGGEKCRKKIEKEKNRIHFSGNNKLECFDLVDNYIKTMEVCSSSIKLKFLINELKLTEKNI